MRSPAGSSAAGPGYRSSRRIVSRWLCLGATLLLAAVGGRLLTPGPARADSAPGSGLGSYSLFATAPGVEWTYDSPTAPTHPELDAEVPETIAQLQPGPVGYGLGAVAWPGTLIANGGSTAGLVGLSLPQPLANNANEPVRAEARTGSGPPTVTNNSYPGTTMTASATDQEVSGSAAMSGTSGPAPGSSTGDTSSSSDVKLVGADQVRTVATSTVKDVDLGGVVKIASVISTVTATSDGTRARVSGSTVVSGMSVAGQPVTLDQSGLHVLTSSAPLNTVASQIVNAAIASFGMKMEVSQPSQTLQGGDVTYDAGSAVFFWSPPGSGGQTFTAEVGGASIHLQAAPGTPGSAAAGLSGPTGPGAVTSAPATGASSGVSATLPSTAPASSTAVSSGPTAAGGGGAAAPLRSTDAGLILPRGLSPVWPILFLLGSAAVAAGLRRLPDRVLEEDPTACPLGGQG